MYKGLFGNLFWQLLYVCLEALGAANVLLLNDMIRTRNWRCVVWAGFYAALDGNPEFGPLLASIDFPLPHNQWIIDLALAELGAKPRDPSNDGIVQLIHEMRRLLRPIKRPIVALRLNPSPEQLKQLEAERIQIRAHYETNGSDAALAAMQGTLSGYYAAGYRNWIARRGGPPPPG